MVRWIARLVLTVFFNTIAVVDVTGMENIPAQGSYVAVSNHLGRLDPALVYYILPRKDVYLMVAEKYQKYAFVRWLVKQLNGMFIDRYNADIRALRLMLERLQDRWCGGAGAGGHAQPQRGADPSLAGRQLPGCQSGRAGSAGGGYRY